MRRPPDAARLLLLRRALIASAARDTCSNYSEFRQSCEFQRPDTVRPDGAFFEGISHCSIILLAPI
jgi:hypothetical protein